MISIENSDGNALIKVIGPGRLHGVAQGIDRIEPMDVAVKMRFAEGLSGSG